MQALKALVVFMGILIFAGLGLLIYGLATRIGGGDDAPPPGANFGVVEQTLPAGAAVDGVSVEDGRAVVRVRLAGGGMELRIFDLASGAAVGTIRLRGAP
jgi:hypothetical protein